MKDSSVQKATSPSQQSLYAVFRGIKYLFPRTGINRTRADSLCSPPQPPTPRTDKCFGHSTISVKEVAGTSFLFFTNSSFPLAVDLFELVAFIAVTIALGIAIVVTSRGSAALLRGLICSWLPGTPQLRNLAAALALLAQLLTSARQVVPTRSHSTLSLLASQCCSL